MKLLPCLKVLLRKFIILQYRFHLIYSCIDFVVNIQMLYQPMHVGCLTSVVFVQFLVLHTNQYLILYCFLLAKIKIKLVGIRKQRIIVSVVCLLRIHPRGCITRKHSMCFPSRLFSINNEFNFNFDINYFIFFFSNKTYRKLLIFIYYVP